jgi:hypothetical protein
MSLSTTRCVPFSTIQPEAADRPRAAEWGSYRLSRAWRQNRSEAVCRKGAASARSTSPFSWTKTRPRRVANRRPRVGALGVNVWPKVPVRRPSPRLRRKSAIVGLISVARVFACGAGDGNGTRSVSLGTRRTDGCLLGLLSVTRSRAARSVPWIPGGNGREWHDETLDQTDAVATAVGLDA